MRESSVLGVGAVVGFVAALTVSSRAIAAEIADYYPLEVGHTWTYETKKHTKISRLFEVQETDKLGTVEQKVVRASRLSKEGRKVFEVRNMVEERGSSNAPVVSMETVLHLSSSPRGVFLHAVDAGGVDGVALPEPVAVLKDPPSTESATSYIGALRVQSSVKSQAVEAEAVEVPAGKFRKVLKRVSKGPISGELSGMPVRSGTATEVSWFAPKVGLVRQVRTLEFKVHDERGVEISVEEKSERVLTKFSTAESRGAKPEKR